MASPSASRFSLPESNFPTCRKMGPPAPPPTPAAMPPPPASSGDGEDNSGKLFAEIAALGESGVRQGLKKAVKGPVKGGQVEKVVTRTKSKKREVQLGGTPKCALAGKKWNVEFQNGANGDKAISIDTTLKQAVYIYKCHDSLIKVNGKVNAIFLDSCSKTSCIFEEAMASVEVVNSTDIQIQCTKTAPAMSIDGCSAVTYYMSSTFKEAKIITAKSAAINLIRPTEDDDIVETPIPEQFSTEWKNGNWVTESVSHED